MLGGALGVLQMLLWMAWSPWWSLALTGALFIYAGASCEAPGSPYMLVAGITPDTCVDPLTDAELATVNYYGPPHSPAPHRAETM